MKIRIATPADIRPMYFVRMSVRENILMNRALVTDEICRQYITERGKGWVCEIDQSIAGFAIADLVDNSVWALFIKPEYEGMGIGQRLHNTMLNWYFSNSKERIWLTTAPDTRAERFYRAAGWLQTGMNKHGELRFELTYEAWMSMNN